MLVRAMYLREKVVSCPIDHGLLRPLHLLRGPRAGRPGARPSSFGWDFQETGWGCALPVGQAYRHWTRITCDHRAYCVGL